MLKKLFHTLKRRLLSRRALRLAAILLSLAALAWLGAWLAQRSLRTPMRKRAMQAWLDNTFNADVAILGSMDVRLNLVRNSRLALNDVEIEHPNPVFPGKLARIGRMAAWARPWSAAGIFPGSMDFLLQNVSVEVEQAPSGEWSHDGLMRPLSSSPAEFPFPMPLMRHWDLDVRNGRLDIRRRGYELALDMNARVNSRVGREYIDFFAQAMPFSFGRADGGERKTGFAGQTRMRLLLSGERGGIPAPIAGTCSATVSNLPVSTLPFIADGIPMEDGEGVFNGLLRYDKHEEAAGSLFVDGELSDASLSVFGLPRTAPFRLNWPIAPNPGAKLQANLRMGPSGFGSFAMTVPLADDGAPEALSLRGDVAVLDALPGFFRDHARWPDWLSRTFPRIEWLSGQWRGFGWEGEKLALSLSRGAAGLTLTGTAGLLGGEARISMSPGSPDTPVILSAERVNGAGLADGLSPMLPEPFRVKMREGAVSLNWRGLPDGGGGIPEWGAGMVWTNPAIDIPGSGGWWKNFARIAEAVAMALPEWGGGDGAELLALSAAKEIRPEQLSVVVEKTADGTVSVEFRAFGDMLGQATGLAERRPDGAVEGEIRFGGDSAVLAAAARANPELAAVLALLANDSSGLRVAFRHDAERGGQFIFPFLEDALRIRRTLERGENTESGENGGETAE